MKTMNTKSFFAILAVAIIAGATSGYAVNKLTSNVVTGGDFPQGITPTNLLTANSSGNYVAPVGSFAFAATNGLYVGGTSQYNNDNTFVSASGTPSVVATLNAFNTATGTTATTSIMIPSVGNLQVGSICSGGAATTSIFVSGCILNSTNGVTGTAIVAYSNLTTGSLSVPTSTRLNVTFDQLPY
jgi:hypothetical protein